MPEPQVKNRNGPVIAAIVIFGAIVGLAILYWLLRQIYIDTHCAEVLGTLICR
jgi:hypothetical protein